MMPASPEGQILIYRDGALDLQVCIEGRTVWLTQRLIAELFQVTVPTMNEHLSNIFAEAELSPEATIRKFRIVQREGERDVSRTIDHYNLDCELAQEHAHAEIPKYEEQRRKLEATQPASDFDSAVEEVKRLEATPKP